MNLIKFLLYAAVFSTVFGELGRYPFGASSVAVNILDILVFLTNLFFAIWFANTKQKLFLPPGYKWLVGFWGVGLASLVWSLTNFPITEVFKGSLYLIRFILYSNIYLISFNLIKSKVMDIEGLIKAQVDTATLFCLLGFAQLIIFPDFDFLLDYGYDPHKGRLTSTFLDPNFAGLYMTFNLGLSFWYYLKSKNITYGIISGLLFLGVILTYSRSAYLMLGSLIIGLVVLNIKKLGWKYLSLVTISCIILLFSLINIFPRFKDRIEGGFRVDDSAIERLESWRDGWQIFAGHPILGVGFNNLRIAQQEHDLVKTYSVDGGRSGAGVDSSLLVILSTTGIVGIIVYLRFWYKLMIFKSTNYYKPLSLVLVLALLLGSQFVNGLLFTPIMVYYFSLLGSTNH